MNFYECYSKYNEYIENLVKNGVTENLFNPNHKYFKMTMLLYKNLLNDVKTLNFTMLYQPQVRSNFNAERAESLFRWNFNGISINPVVCFYIAKQANIEKLIVKKQLQKICMDTKYIIKHLHKDFITAFNLNPKLFNRAFCDYYLETLNKYGLDSHNIGIELLETDSFENVKVEDMLYLQKTGTRFYLDDYNCLNSNFETLNNLPFNYVKLDGSKIEGIEYDISKQEFVKQTVDYCKKRNIKTIAEKVETYPQMKTVKKLGVNGIQGYYFSPPLEINEFISKCDEINNNIKL